MSEATAPVASTAPAVASTTPTTPAPQATTPAPDAVTGLEVQPTQGNLFEKPLVADPVKAEPAKVEPIKEVDKETPKATGDKTPEPPQKSIQEMGFTDISADQTAVAELSTELGVNFDTLRGAITDGRLDTSKLEGLTPRDAQLLKTTVDAEIIKLVNDKNTRRSELHEHVGGENNFKTMVDWVNTAMKSDANLRTEVAELRNMMTQGGRTAELAVKALFDKFKADPTTSLPLTSNAASDSPVPVGAAMTKRETLDKGWAAFQQKHRL